MARSQRFIAFLSQNTPIGSVLPTRPFYKPSMIWYLAHTMGMEEVSDFDCV
jgi:hypothetical protein